MTITLDLQKSKGVTLNLTKDLPSLKKLTARLGWQPHPVTGKSLTAGFDLDIAVFALNAKGKLDSGQDVIFFNNPRYEADSIVLPADNRDGSDHPEEIHFSLPDVPANRHQLDIYVTIFEFAQRKQSWAPRGHEYGSGAIWKYAQLVGPARYGALTNPGAKGEKEQYADI